MRAVEVVITDTSCCRIAKVGAGDGVGSVTTDSELVESVMSETTFSVEVVVEIGVEETEIGSLMVDVGAVFCVEEVVDEVLVASVGEGAQDGVVPGDLLEVGGEVGKDRRNVGIIGNHREAEEVPAGLEGAASRQSRGGDEWAGTTNW